MLLLGKLEHLGLIGSRASTQGRLYESLHQLSRMQHDLIRKVSPTYDFGGERSMDVCLQIPAVKPPGREAISFEQGDFVSESAQLFLCERQADHTRLPSLTWDRFLLDNLLQESLTLIGKGHRGVSGLISQACDSVGIQAHNAGSD